jgi:hypothetical protein
MAHLFTQNVMGYIPIFPITNCKVLSKKFVVLCLLTCWETNSEYCMYIFVNSSVSIYYSFVKALSHLQFFRGDLISLLISFRKECRLKIVEEKKHQNSIAWVEQLLS